MLPLVRVVVFGGTEVGVVHLRAALRDVRATGDVDGREAEPAVVAVASVADLRGAGDHRAVLVRRAVDDGGQDSTVTGTPVLRCLREMPPPIRSGHVVAEFQGELRLSLIHISEPTRLLS